MIYCPYTNKFYSKEKTNSEHIIPLSLGGAKGFEIPVEIAFNKTVGSQIDGKLANDLIILLNRIKNNTKGHRRKPPALIAKRAVIENNHDSIRFEIDRINGIQLWNNRNKEKVEFNSTISFTFTSNLTKIKETSLKFVAKTALSAGYYIYNDIFRTEVKHEDLRLIMNFSGNYNDPQIRNLQTSVDYQYSNDKSPYLQAFKLVTSIVSNSSCVGLVPFNKSLVVFVGILGQYIGMVNVPCNSSKFPNDGINEWGTFICIQDKKPIICSWKRIVTRIGDLLETK